MASKQYTDSKQDVVEDFLDEDVEIPGQRYALVSFLSPEKVLTKKDLFFFHRFLDTYELEWKTKPLETFLVDTVKNVNAELEERIKELENKDQMEAAELLRKNRLPVHVIMADYEKFVKSQQKSLTVGKLKEAFDDYLFQSKKTLEDEFYALNDFHTSMRGVKVRGVYGTVKEAELKAKKLQNKDKYHNIFMAEVGKWTPWDPNPNEVHDQDYNNDQLNTLMQKYKENEDSREKFFEERTKGGKEKSGKINNSIHVVSDLPSTSSTSTSYDSLFQDQGDLVLQRKMERENNEDKKE